MKAPNRTVAFTIFENRTEPDRTIFDLQKLHLRFFKTAPNRTVEYITAPKRTVGLIYLKTAPNCTVRFPLS